MRVLLDGEQVGARASGDMVLGQIVESVQRLLAGSDHAIRSISVDGVELASWAEEAGRSLDGVAEIHVVTTPIKLLLAEAAQSALVYLPSLEAGIAQAAQCFLEGDDKQGSDTLGQVVEGLRWYATLLTDTVRLGYGTGSSAEDRVRRLRDQLQGIVAVWEERDYGLLADLLQYELVSELAEARDWLDQWVKSLDRIEG